MSSLFLSVATLLLSSFLLCWCWHVDGAAVSHHVVTVSSLLSSDVCYSSKGFNHTGLKVAHRHGPCSPLPRRKSLNHHLLLDKDQIRVATLFHTTTSTPASSRRPKPHASLASSSIPATTGTALGTGNYIVTIGFGTPRKPFSVIFDTGSDVTWIQCQPCVSYCYPQQEPLFDPAKSSTYSNISCSSPFCSQLDISGCSASACLYAVQYGDRSSTVGFFAQDTLSLTPTDSIPNFRFGCGEQNRGLFGKAAGLLGLGRQPVSLISQTSAKYGGVFSYCLPSTASSTGYLSFGPATSNPKYTQMLTDPNSPTFYYLNLVGINVGGQKLSIEPTVFSTAGTIIDSGTVISRLPPAAYTALRTAFRQRMTQYPTAPALSILDTCYNFTGYSTVSIPSVALVFGGGVTVSLDFSGVIYAASVSQACLGFAGNSNATDLGIIGNTQQRTLDVVYDVSKKLIGFGPGGCS